MIDPRITSESEVIALLATLTAGAPGALGLKDDCARLSPKAGFDLVLKTDPVREGVHFFADDPPEAIAWKALAVNVSDLAAKGADPVAYLLALSFPEAPSQSWMAAFVRGLAKAQAAFGCHLIGGDTDRAPGPLSIGITVIGEVPAGSMVQRGTARVGDALYVSGSLGNAALGLRLHAEAREARSSERSGRLDAWGMTEIARQTLLAAYLTPQPRLMLRHAVRDFAGAAMDVSDGVVKDLERMCLASGVGAVVQCEALPISPEARAVLAREPGLFPAVVSAGDDYEILAAVREARAVAFEDAARVAGVPVHRIGAVVEERGVKVLSADGSLVTFERKGWDHF